MTDRKMGITYKEFKEAVDSIDVSDKIKRYFMDLICKAALTSLTEKERQEYRDHYFAVTYDDIIESARDEGMEEGMEKGKAEGIRQVAKSLLSQGVSLSQSQELRDYHKTKSVNSRNQVSILSHPCNSHTVPLHTTHYILRPNHIRRRLEYLPKQSCRWDFAL